MPPQGAGAAPGDLRHYGLGKCPLDAEDRAREFSGLWMAHKTSLSRSSPLRDDDQIVAALAVTDVVEPV